MSEQITTAFVKQFEQGIMHLAQQSGSKLMNAVSVVNGITGDRDFFDQLGATVATQLTNRHADTELTDTPHARRMLTTSKYAVADMVDEYDKVRVLNDPTNDYAKSFAWAIGRSIDDDIITSFFGSASTGVDGATPATFPAANVVPLGAAGLTVAKLRNAREILEAYEEVEDDGENQWYIACNARQRRDLLATTEVTSTDFNSVQALVQGHVDTFLGFKFLKTQRTVLDSNLDRRVPAWNKSAMKLGFNQNITGSIDRRPDKNNGIQVYFRADFGSTRMRETGVVEILCDET